jgi:GTP pyrophosphokinase
VPLSHKLNSGDQVEILTSKSQHVSPSWINFVSTAKAKAKIQAILRRDSRETLKTGEEILLEFLKKNEMDLTPAIIDQLAEFHESKSREELYQSLGDKTILLGDKDIDELKGKNKSNENSRGWRRYVPFVKAKKKELPSKPEMFIVPDKFNRKKPIYITDENIRQYKFPTCCHPIPGDEVLGFLDETGKMYIHKVDCPEAALLKTSYGKRLYSATWNTHRVQSFVETIELKGIDKFGVFIQVLQTITTEFHINMRQINVSSDDGIFKGTMEIYVYDRKELDELLKAIRKIDDIKEVKRVVNEI